jgi:hypothetical protein
VRQPRRNELIVRFVKEEDSPSKTDSSLCKGIDLHYLVTRSWRCQSSSSSSSTGSSLQPPNHKRLAVRTPKVWVELDVAKLEAVATTINVKVIASKREFLIVATWSCALVRDVYPFHIMWYYWLGLDLGWFHLRAPRQGAKPRRLSLSRAAF